MPTQLNGSLAAPPLTPDAAELTILTQFGGGFLKLPLGGDLEPASAKLAFMRAVVSEWIRFVDMDLSPRVVDGKIVKMPHRVFMLTEAGRARLGQLRVGARG